MAGSIRLSLNEVYKMYTTQNLMTTSFCRRNFLASLSKFILFDETYGRLSSDRWMCSNQPSNNANSVFYSTHLNSKSSNRDKFCVNQCGPKLDHTSDQRTRDSRKIRHNKPTLEDQMKIFNTLKNDLPKFFIQSMDYSIYSRDIVFENNIQGLKTSGLTSYMVEAAKLRTIGHFKFAYVRFEILHMNLDEMEKCVKIRWRITGISALKVMAMFWRYKPWELKKVLMEGDKWYDGFSLFYIGEDGKVFKHIADKLMPDDEKALERINKQKEGIPALKTLFVVKSEEKNYISITGINFAISED